MMRSLAGAGGSVGEVTSSNVGGSSAVDPPPAAAAAQPAGTTTATVGSFTRGPSGPVPASLVRPLPDQRCFVCAASVRAASFVLLHLCSFVLLRLWCAPIGLLHFVGQSSCRPAMATCLADL